MILVNVPAPTQRLHLDALFIKRSQHCNEHVCTRSLQIRLQFSGPPSNGCQIPAGNFSGTFFFTCFPRFDFHCWIVEPRHFLEWALETLKHESRFIGPVGSFQNGRIGTQQLQKKDGTDGVTVNLVKSRCSGKDSWNHFLKRVLDMSCSKATVFFSWVCMSVFLWSYLNLVNHYWPSGEFLANFCDNTRTRFWLAIHHYRCWISISLSHVSAQKQSVLFCQSHQLFLRRLHDIALLRTL